MLKKKSFRLLFSVAMLVLLFASSVMVTFADGAEENQEITVKMTIIKKLDAVTCNDGNPFIQREVKVSDVDSDGVFTMDDAFVCGHTQYGNSSDYEIRITNYVLSMKKLWGVENGGCFGYYCNNVASNSLSDVIKDGDQIVAYVYSDTNSFSDRYGYFDTWTKESNKKNVTLEFCVSYIGYDSSYNKCNIVVNNATVGVLEDETITGTTDSEGKVSLTFKDNGTYTVYAKSASDPILQTPYCIVTINEPEAETPVDESSTDESSTDEIINEDPASGDTDIVEKPIAVNDIIDSNDATYVVTVAESGKQEVEYIASLNKNATAVTVPDTVTINGVKYKVTSIKANAYKNNKKIKKIVIGKNIKKIGKNAFYGCKNLKTVIIKTTKLTKKTVGKNAFAKIHKKAKVKVPKKKLKSYKKILKARGINKKTQKITK